jgi:hypothetical protein
MGQTVAGWGCGCPFAPRISRAEAAVDVKKFGNALAVVGVALLIGALVWWYSFYSSAVQDFAKVTGLTPQTSISDALTCLYSSSGMCGIVTAAAPIVGRTAYEPMLFWFGLAALLLGVLIRYTAKPSGTGK